MDLAFIVLLVVLVVAAVAYWWFFMKRKSAAQGGDNRVNMTQDSDMEAGGADKAEDTVVKAVPETSADMGGERIENEAPAEVEEHEDTTENESENEEN